MLYDGNDASVGHVPYQDLSVLGHTARQEQAVVVGKIDEGHAVVMFRQSEQQASLLEAPDDNVRVMPPLAGRNISVGE